MKVEIVTRNKEHRHNLELLVPYKIGMMDALSKKYDFPQPKVVKLRPLKEVCKDGPVYTLAWAGYSLASGFYISLRMWLFEQGIRFALYTLAHEVAHIAVCKKHRIWGHPKIHTEMTEFAKQWLEKEADYDELNSAVRIGSELSVLSQRVLAIRKSR